MFSSIKIFSSIIIFAAEYRQISLHLTPVQMHTYVNIWPWGEMQAVAYLQGNILG